MFKILEYYGRYQGLRGNLGGLPSWARLILLVAALPGIALLALSLLAIGVSILALLLLTLPTFRILRWLTGGRASAAGLSSQRMAGMPGVTIDLSQMDGMAEPGGSDNSFGGSEAVRSPARRHVDVKIIE